MDWLRRQDHLLSCIILCIVITGLWVLQVGLLFQYNALRLCLLVAVATILTLTIIIYELGIYSHPGCTGFGNARRSIDSFLDNLDKVSLRVSNSFQKLL